MKDGNEIKMMLAERAQSVCEILLPAGKREGMHWKVGDIYNNPGSSLVVDLEGKTAGRFKDFAGDASGGNLLELWVQVKGCSFVEALKEASDWMGVSEIPLQRKRFAPEKVKGGGNKKLICAPVVEGSAVWKWLTEVRKIHPAAIEAYKIGEARFPWKSAGGKEVDWVVFPFYDADGNLVRLKYRDIADKKNMFQAPSVAKAPEYEHGYQKLLFGIQAVPCQATKVAITEGELDAMSMFQAGAIGAVSLPEGAQVKDQTYGDESPHDQWLEHDHDWLSRFTDVYLALDGDEHGRKATEQIAPRVGLVRCSLVEWPEGVKDANEAMEVGVALDQLVVNAKNYDPPELRKPSDFAKDIWEEFYPETSDKPKGDDPPWGLPFTFNRGELVVWQGYNGHGKTMMMNNCLVDIGHQGRKVVVASLEMEPAVTFTNMTRQTLCGRPGEEQRLWKALDWLDRHFIVYNKVGQASSLDILEAFEYAYRKYGVSHFVIDSLMMLEDVDQDDYKAQGDVCKALKAFAADHDVCLHLVCHSKKPSEKRPAEKKPPLKYDISGSAVIPNIASSIIAVWRNQEKEANLRDADYELSRGNFEGAQDIRSKWENVYDALFQVQKQRKGGEEPGRRLWFDRESFQFLGKQGDSPKQYVTVE